LSLQDTAAPGGTQNVAPTVGGVAIPDEANLTRMRRDRFARLVAAMDREGVDGMVLLGSGAVTYATGASVPGSDSSRALLGRPVAVVSPDESAAHLFTSFPEGAGVELGGGILHDGIAPDLPEGAEVLARFLEDTFAPGSRIAFDDIPVPLRARVVAWDVVAASAALNATKLCKGVDELACIRRAQSINESAMLDVYQLLRPGVRQTDLTSLFMRRIFELGATANCIDPIWQPMPAGRDAGPWTTHGDVAFPLAATDAFLRDGDVVWVDTGISYEGYASDFGRTWIVDARPRPSARQQSQFERWWAVMQRVLEVCRPGATALDLCRAATEANGGVRPWLEHFYLAHGIGTESAEMPLIGTDLGEEFDASLVLAPGMVLVLEPVIWDDGASGYRSEDVYAVTDDGWAPLSSHPFDPFRLR
jgi:Xaa-Pro dipeptidase